MSEFETNPEQALRAELSAAETRLGELDEQYAKIQNGDLEATGSKDTERQIELEANKYQRRIFDILTQLQDYTSLREKLEAKLPGFIDLYAEFDELPEIGIVVTDVYNVVLGTEELDNRFVQILDDLTREYGLPSPGEDSEE